MLHGRIAASVRRGARILALLGWALAGAALAPGRASAQSDRPEVTELRFEGNRTFSDHTLSRAIVTSATRCKTPLQPFCWMGLDFAIDRAFLNPREFRRDAARIKVFYYQRGYREAEVDTVRTLAGNQGEEKVRVTFTIEEGRPVRADSIAILGLEDLGIPELARDLPLETGDPLNGLALDAARDTLLSRLQNRGYAHADVLRSFFIPTEEPYSAEVTFDAFPGPRSYLGPVVISGNEQVSERVVRRMLPFREGQLYRREVLFEGQRRLFNLEIFRHANISQDLEHDPDSVVPIEVQVNEGNVHRVRTGVGWSTADCVDAEASWSSRNFVGGARRLQIRARISNVLASRLSTACYQVGQGEFAELNWLVGADFTQPWIFSPRNSLSAGLFAERQSLQEVFIRRGFGGNLGLTRGIGRGTSLTISYRPQLSELESAQIFFCTSFLVCDPQDIGALSDQNWLAPLGLSLVRDRTNRAVDPTSGYTTTLDFELARAFTHSDFRYERAVAEATWLTQPSSGLVFALKARGGWLNPREFGGGGGVEGDVANPQTRFFAGGANSVRGFAQNQLGPRVLGVGVERLVFSRDGEPPVCAPEEVVDFSCNAGPLPDGAFDTPRPTGGSRLMEGSLEVRFGLGLQRLQGATYLDWGQVWTEEEDLSLRGVELTPGFGFRYATPIGPIRLDLAYKFSPAEQLRVVTSRLVPFDPFNPDHRLEDRISQDGVTLDYIRTDELAPLEPRVTFGDAGTFDLSRFQLHLSIGQAF